jgi:uncharacterized damage-inducible protein DinB
VDELGRILVENTRRLLVESYPSQIREALETLDEEQVWWRPNPGANSVGNLVLHLVGSSRHFIGRGLGGSSFVRDRPAEFAERGPIPSLELRRHLDEVTRETAGVLDSLDSTALLDVSSATGEPHTAIALLLRVAHHWAVHTGQIVYVAKSLHEGAFDELWRRTMG